MSAERLFHDALARLTLDHDESALPARVAMAVAESLPIDGASFSIAALGLRVPLGASDELSAEAERLQFTLGDGPCMMAIDTGVVISMPETLLTQRWPALAEAWTSKTSFRSVVSQPLAAPSEVGVALNMFFEHPSAGVDLDPVAVAAIALAAGNVLFPSAASPTLLSTRSAARRLHIWVAVGVVMRALHIDAPAALDLLRAHAFVSDVTLDDVAAAFVDQPELVTELDN